MVISNSYACLPEGKFLTNYIFQRGGAKKDLVGRFHSHGDTQKLDGLKGKIPNKNG